MATTADYISLRANTGDSITSLDDPAAAAIFAQAATLYSPGAVFAGTRVLRILELLGGAYKKVSYTQNQESVSATDIFKNLMILLTAWQKRLDDAIEAGNVGAAQPPPSGTVPLRARW